MKYMLVIMNLLMLLSCAGVTASERKVSKSDALDAFREYRKAARMIVDVHKKHMAKILPDDPDAEAKFSKDLIAQYLQARKHLEKSIAHNPYFPDAYLLLANSYWDIEDDLQKTVEFYTKALEIDPEYADVISARAQVYILLARVKDAEQDLLKLDKLKSEHADPLRAQINEFKEQQKLKTH